MKDLYVHVNVTLKNKLSCNLDTILELSCFECAVPLLPDVWWVHWCRAWLIQEPEHQALKGTMQKLWHPTLLLQALHLISDQFLWKDKKGGNRNLILFPIRLTKILTYLYIIGTNLIISPMIALRPYSVLHTETAWANTEDNCSKCCSNWITLTLAPGNIKGNIRKYTQDMFSFTQEGGSPNDIKKLDYWNWAELLLQL